MNAMFRKMASNESLASGDFASEGRKNIVFANEGQKKYVTFVFRPTNRWRLAISLAKAENHIVFANESLAFGDFTGEFKCIIFTACFSRKCRRNLFHSSSSLTDHLTLTI